MSPPSPHGSRSSMSSLPKPYYDEPAVLDDPKPAHRAPAYAMSDAYPHQAPRSPPSPPYFPPAGASAGLLGGPPHHKKKYQCTTCGRGFTTGGHLARHRRIHTGERNHVCPFPGCETRCSRQDNLQQHYRIHLSPGSRRTTGQATRAAMHRAMSQSRQPARAPAQAAQATSPAQYTHTRLPPMDMDAKDELAYHSPLLTPPAARPPPPDLPPPLECAYRVGGPGSVSSQSSARSSPELPPHPLARATAAAAFPDAAAGYPPHREGLALAHNAPKGSQWELGSRSGPSSPDYEDEPSPEGTGTPYTDTDEASSSGSSAGSPQTLSPQGTPRHYYSAHQGFHTDRPHHLSLPPVNLEPTARQTQAAPQVYYPYAPSPVSPASSQPPSPTYAAAPAASFAHSHSHSFAGGMQPGYSAQAASPAHRYAPHTHAPAHYDHPAAHARFPSGTTLPPINVHVAGARDAPRQADRRTPAAAEQLHPHANAQAQSPAHAQSRPAPALADARAPREDAYAAHTQAHTHAHAHGHASLGYAYSPYSPLSPEHQAWDADLRPRTTLVAS